MFILTIVRQIKRTIVREWVDAIIFAVIAATIIRTFLFEAYTIPTSSMEKTLLVGDFLFVSKITYGPRIPNTPICFSFCTSYIAINRKYKIISGMDKAAVLQIFRDCRQSIKRYDCVVFNYPDGDT